MMSAADALREEIRALALQVDEQAGHKAGTTIGKLQRRDGWLWLYSLDPSELEPLLAELREEVGQSA